MYVLRNCWLYIGKVQAEAASLIIYWSVDQYQGKACDTNREYRLQTIDNNMHNKNNCQTSTRVELLSQINRSHRVCGNWRHTEQMLNYGV